MAKSSFFSGTGVSTTNTNAIENSVESAAASATAASTSATSAAASATSASANIAANQASAAASEASKVTAVAAKVTAVAAQAAALTSANNASTSATASEASKVTAVAAQTSATASSTSAATSATTATTKAAAASISQAAAATSAANAQSYASSSLPLSGGNLTGNLGLPVNGKIILGSSTSNSLQVYNDGSNSIITESSAGSLLLRGNSLYLQDVSNNNYVQALSGGAVTLYDNTGGSPSPKIATSSSGASISGNIAVTGTVDGRDVATDGTKLDTIETSATADQTNAEIRTAVEAASDSNVFTDADHSKLNAIEASATADQTNAEIKTAYESNSDTNAFTDADHTKLDGIAASANNYVLPSGYATETYVTTQVTNLVDSSPATLNTLNELAAALGDDPNFATTTANSIGTKAALSGAVFTGAITTNSTIDGRDVATDGTKLDGVEASADVTDATNVTAAGALMDSELTSIASVKALNQGVATGDSPTFAALTSTGEITANGGIALGDNDKATFGASDDLQIYHDGSHSYVADSGTGNLYIAGDNEIIITDAAQNEYKAKFNTNGSVQLYYDNAEKLATTSTGIDVTGTATMDGLSASASTTDYIASITNSNGSDAGKGLFVSTRWNTATNSVAKFVSNSGSNAVANFAGNGDISFYEDTGTTPKLFWDASAESLGIGTSTPNVVLHTVDASGTAVIALDDSRSNVGDTASVEFRHNGITGSIVKSSAIEDFSVAANRSSDLQFWTRNNGTQIQAATIDSSGNVGIGTSSPTTALQIGDGTDTANWLRLTGTTSDLYIGQNPVNDSFGQTNAAKILSVASYPLAMGTANAYPIIFGTNDIERMRIDSSGNVGINQSSPSSYYAKNLVVGAANEEGITLAATATSATNYLLFADGTSGDAQYRGQIAYSHSSDNLDLVSTGTMTFKSGSSRTQRMTIDSSGNVGIGANSISQPSAGATTLKIKSTHNDKAGSIYLESANASVLAYIYPDSTNGLSINTSTSHPILFRTVGAERMRIDASGNLLVGTTNTYPADNNVTGHSLTAVGQLQSSVSGYAPFIANRKASDGAIAIFAKDGTTVGSIGSSSPALYIGSGDVGVRFDGANDRIRPVGNASNLAAVRDGAIDLGDSGARFKDLYLSGGVYLGGTGAANKLDDYEEGTWTPAITGSGGTSGTAYTTQVGGYTKVGNKVTANFHVKFSNEGTLTGTTRISGLPFIGTTTPQYCVAATTAGSMNIDADQQVVAIQYAANAILYLFLQEPQLALAQISGNTSFTNTSEIAGSVSYFTNS